MTLAMMITAAAIYYFLLPSKLVIGTVAGFGIVLGEAFSTLGIQIKVSTIILLINVFLLVIACLLIGKDFGLKTVYTSLILGPLMDLFEKICPYEKLVDPSAPIPSVMGDLWFDLIVFVLLISIAQTLTFSINASTGGLDIVAKIVNRYFHYDMGACVIYSGVLICATAFLINPVRLVIIGLLGTWLNGVMIDYFTASFNKRKRVCIISEESDLIRDYIVNHIHRGCTLYEIRGGFEKESKVEIETILTQEEFSTLMAFMKNRKIEAFMTAGNVSEVYGTWFKHRKAD